MDGVDGHGAAQGSRGAFGEAEVAHFARVDGRGHGGDDGFDGDFAVEAVTAVYTYLQVTLGWGEEVVTNQYQRSMWSVCSLFRLSSIAFRMYSGSLEKMRVPSAKPLTANLVARKTLSFSQHHTHIPILIQKRR